MEQKEKVLLFGRGMVYQRKKEKLLQDYKVEAFLDNVVLPGQVLEDESTGIPVLNPANISCYPGIPIFLLSYALGDMCRQLLELGVDRNRLRFGPSVEPYNTFEEMLFGSGGSLNLEEGEVFYLNERAGLRIQTNPSDLEKLTEKLRTTSLYPDVSNILERIPVHPIDDTYGRNRGTPVDRYYIEQFLNAQKEWIQGSVMEIGDRAYTDRFGGNRVTDSMILHVEEEKPEICQIKGDLVTGGGLIKESVDCLICTQTLPFIYDLSSAVKHIMMILKKGGTALLTVGGISQIIQYEMVHYGHFWSFTDLSLRRLFEERNEVASIETVTYGNVKSAMAFLYGISYEELKREELDFHDPAYQLIIGAVVRKQ